MVIAYRAMGGGPSSKGAVIDGAVYDARTEAQRIVAGARAEAARIVAAAEAAREEFRRAGHAAGREEAAAGATEMLVRARAELERLRHEACDDLKRVAVRAAERILGRQLDLDPDAVIDICRSALGAVRRARAVLLRVHPEDLARVSAARPRLASALARPGADVAVELRPDATVSRGGCLVETESGIVDARLETQLAAIERALLG
jgi:type III secretion system HrpE/YscL family protein